MRVILHSVSILLLMSGCKDLGPLENHGQTARVDGAHFQIDNPIVLQIQNSGDSAVNLESCCSGLAYYLDHSSNGIWQLYQARGIPCLLTCPSILLSLLPGASYEVQLTIAEAGQYRLRIPYRIEGQGQIGGESLSNPFTVE